jgi:hypothetical protein
MTKFTGVSKDTTIPLSERLKAASTNAMENGDVRRATELAGEGHQALTDECSRDEERRKAKSRSPDRDRGR